MKDFLSDFMAEYRNNEVKIREFRDVFTKTVFSIDSKINPHPFKIKAGLQAAVFDSVMVAFALNLNNIPPNIRERHQKLLKDKEYEESVYKFTTVEKFVKQRIDMAIKKLFQQL